MLMRFFCVVALCLTADTLMPAQAVPAAGDLQRVMERLDRLEKQNQELQSEVQELRRQLAGQQAGSSSAEAATPGEPNSPAAPTPAERLDVQESRTAELAQSKMGTSQRMPVELTGMLLFNAFHNGGFGGGLQMPITAQLTESATSTGASFRQTVIGLKFNGPELPGGGKASGSAYFDFWGGSSIPSNNLFRIRLATLDLAWKNTTITAGQDKPIIAPREPTSFAQVGFAPLTGAGNLWDWQPQVRIEQRFTLRHGLTPEDSETGMRVQAGVFETAEVAPAGAPGSIANTLERQRPAYEARVLFFSGNDRKRLEIAPGFHLSTTHIAGQSVASQLGTLDWLVKPNSRMMVSGAMFRGINAAGLGSLRQGFTILPNGSVVAVHATGIWSQLSVFATSRVTLNIFGGQESDRAADLATNSVRRNLVYTGNIMYKFASNVIAAMEFSQTRTGYVAAGTRLNNHYDLALAYLF